MNREWVKVWQGTVNNIKIELTAKFGNNIIFSIVSTELQHIWYFFREMKNKNIMCTQFMNENNL